LSLLLLFFCSTILRSHTSTLFPYTTLFRSPILERKCRKTYCVVLNIERVRPQPGAQARGLNERREADRQRGPVLGRHRQKFRIAPDIRRALRNALGGEAAAHLVQFGDKYQKRKTIVGRRQRRT